MERSYGKKLSQPLAAVTEEASSSLSLPFGRPSSSSPDMQSMLISMPSVYGSSTVWKSS